MKKRLIIIGGHEDRDNDHERTILKEVAEAAQGERSKLVIMTVATQDPKGMAEMYTQIFTELGLRTVTTLDIRSRDDACAARTVSKLDDAGVVFFTGGDQLRITSQLGDSPVFQRLMSMYGAGSCLVAGTSAGAAAMPETMIFSGEGDESQRISALGMAPGLGFIPGVVIDSHFAERGRFGRLFGAVAQNPKNLGLGLDEDTAVVVEEGKRFRVSGSGAVYVVDGSSVSFSSLSESSPEGVLSLFDLRLHVLGREDRFDMERRRPMAGKK